MKIAFYINLVHCIELYFAFIIYINKNQIIINRILLIIFLQINVKDEIRKR
jgi:hypothetical protein